MATVIWRGGAAKVAQVWKGNITTTTSGHTYIITLTAEDGSTTETFTYTNGASVGTTTAAAETFVSEWNSNSGTLISQVTASNIANQVVLTADVAGRPFLGPSATIQSGTGTWATGVGITTSNSGPNDWNTLANWVDETEAAAGALPVDNDTVKILSGSDSILYGLDQSGINLSELRIGPGFKGEIGQTALEYYLQIKVDASVTGAVNELHINTPLSNAIWLDTDAPELFIYGTSTSSKAVNLKGSDLAGNLYILGSGVQGTINIADAADVANIYMMDSPGAKLVIGQNVTNLGSIQIGSGQCTTSSVITTINLFGSGVFISTKDVELVSTANVRGGTFYCDGRWGNGSGALGGTLNLWQGQFNLTRNETSSVKIQNVNMYGGILDERGSQSNVQFTATTWVQYGGQYFTAQGNTLTVS